ncbi:MAG TPA: hypothetical protein VEG64_14780 [Candidatus Sulfotelmatobacter sp.]|nr:hypothetical protein [Candidatus Sulfotelmatobacter sp.]
MAWAEGLTAEESTFHGRTRRAWMRTKDGIRDGIGWCLESTGAPAKLKMFEFVDPVSNETIYLYTSKRFSVLCIGERRFYFDRITGSFDGVSSPATNSIARWLKLGN